MPNIDVNLQTILKSNITILFKIEYFNRITAMYYAINSNCIKTVKLLLSMPKIDAQTIS